MKVKKVIEVPFGCCSESIVWEVGSETCQFVSTTGITTNPLSNMLGEKPLWWHILNEIGKNIPTNS